MRRLTGLRDAVARRIASRASAVRFFGTEEACMKSDAQLQSDVEAELEWDPSIDARGIKVAVKNGMVVLTGLVPSYPDKTGADMAVKRISGVREVRNDLSVELAASDIPPDDQITETARAILATQLPLWADASR
jgi:hypothetical protein